MARIELSNGILANYDVLADTLYLSVGKPQRVLSSFLDDNYVLVRKIGDTVCGITIDGFKNRHIDRSWSDSLILNYFPNTDVSPLESLIAN